MADNYLENQYEAYLARKAAKEKKKKLLFKKQLYKRRIKDPDFVNVSPKNHQRTMARCVDGVS